MIAEPDRFVAVGRPTRAGADAGGNGQAGKRCAETTPWSSGAVVAPSGGPSRPRSGLWRRTAHRVAAAALSLALGVACAQEEVPSPPQTLPPLPLPTAAQLERGRDLLEKIGYVVANVPLTDAAAVLAVFGFTDLFTKEYPTYIGVGPKGKSGSFSQPRDLVGTGWADIEVRPKIEKPTGKRYALFFGRLSLDETCISIDMVREFLAPLASQIESARILDIHPVLRPKALHTTGRLSASLTRHPFSAVARLNFRFEYQTCATDFSFSHAIPLEETIQ